MAPSVVSMHRPIASLSYGRIFCLEFQKIDGTYQWFNHYFEFFLLEFYFIFFLIWLQFTQNWNLKKEPRYEVKQLFLFERAVTQLCRPTGYRDYLWASRPMFSVVGLFLGLKSKISYEQNVIYFQFYIRLPNFRVLDSIIFKKSPIRLIPLSILTILYRLFFETQGRKYGRVLKLVMIGG